MNWKAIVRFFYANVPGLAAVRFTAMDLTAAHFAKPEYGGVLCLSVGDGLIIDVGANRGQGIAAFKKLAPESRIIAFEPEPRSSERLSLRYQRDRTVVVYGCALGEHSGAVTFFVPNYGWWDCDGMSATNRKAATEWLRDPGRMFHFNEAKLTVKEHQIECKPLDSYNLSPLLIKLHAQGAELEILKGSKQTILQQKPALMCAFPSIELAKLLGDWGYQPFVYQHGCFAPGVAKRPITFTWYLTDAHVREVPICRKPATLGIEKVY